MRGQRILIEIGIEGGSAMNLEKSSIHRIDSAVVRWMARFGPALLRISLGIIFLWFGILKFFPNLSPAQDLATRTISVLTMGLVPPSISLPLLAAWECLIGIGLLIGHGLRFTLFLLYIQMLGTLTPVFLFPNEVFVRIPYAPTLEGQYIIKNMVLISAGIVVGATVRGGRMVPEPLGPDLVAWMSFQEDRKWLLNRTIYL
jgi:uncharacterized membrane protein YphA (DoxX/SURF4 family)